MDQITHVNVIGILMLGQARIAMDHDGCVFYGRYVKIDCHQCCMLV